MVWDKIQDEYIAVLTLLCLLSRVALFDMVFMGQAAMQEKDNSGSLSAFGGLVPPKAGFK